MMTPIFAALFVATTAAVELPPWRNPEVTSINRLPPRTLIVPSESEEIAVSIADGSMPRTSSRYVQSLNGIWDFKWKPNPDDDWQKETKIAVPGCWQLQGAFDPPLYTNVKYPIGFDGTGDPMIEPPKDYTAYKFRNPVGLYKTTFKRPWRWWFRRTVLRFYGVSSAFYVRVNGKEVGYAEDSRLPNEFDISDYLHIFGENTLEVEVYKHSDGSYLEDQDFWRLSGIFRDVELISERKSAPYDLIAKVSVNDDFSNGHLVLTDEKGTEIKVRDVANPKLWSPAYPYIYMTPVEHKWGWWIFGGVDYYMARFGFRKIEIKNSVIYLNGERILFKGVNRHEMSPERGYAVTQKEMQRDIDLMKEYNVNAVRTCHYPDHADWYVYTDRDGIMVICEANVEAHGVPGFYGKGDQHLPKNPRFHDAIVERNTRMVGFFKNHPSIVIWSLGNESGDGPAMADAYKAIKALDSTRLVQYEGAQDSDHSDVKCPMYWRPWACENYVKNNPKKPMVLCEYTHAMGNSNGDAQDYWDLAKKYPSFQGGFVWDFVDQAIWRHNAEGKRILSYGGDFGDKPNDDNFNCNGLFDALRNPHPGANELQHCYQPVEVTSYDWATDKHTVAYNDPFHPKDDYEEEIDKSDPNAVTFRYYLDGDLVAWTQFAKPFQPKAIAFSGAELKDHPFKLNFWRAPTDNDRGWGMPKTCAIWKQATQDQRLPNGVKNDLKVLKLGDGRTLVDWTLTVPKGLPPIPRVGLTFTVPKKERTIEWYGLGPWENYSDRKTSALLGTHKAVIALMRDHRFSPQFLNPDNYIEPGEQGYRTGVWNLKLGQIEIEAVNAPFGFNAWPYPQTELEGKKHIEEMQEGDAITLNIDAAQMGVGGDDSWGARPHDDAMLGAGSYRLVFTVKGL